MHRIDIIIHELNQSGVSNASLVLANALLENGMQTRLIVVGESATPPFPPNKDLEIKFLGIKKSKTFFGKVLYFIRSYFILSVYLARSQSRNVFVWGKEFTVLAEIFRITLPLRFKLIGVCVTNISYHMQYGKNLVIRSAFNWVYKTFLNKSDHIIAQSAGMTEELTNIYNVQPDKITVIYPPMQLKFFNAPVKKNRNNKIIFIGRLSEEKDLFTALEIFNKLENKNATLEFIGEGELEIPLQEKVTELGLEARVSFAGRQNDVLPFLNEADVLILTSKYEGFGMVLAESIACGVPVVSFDCPSGPAEIIIDGINGYLIPQGNIDLFAKKLDKALTQEWDYNKISETSKKFHPDIVIKKYIEVIKQNLA